MRKCNHCESCMRYLLIDNNYLVLICDLCKLIFKISREGLVEVPKDDELYTRVEFRLV